MAGDPSAGFLERIFKKKRKTDIELPNESGMVDKRIPDIPGAFSKAAKNFKEYQRKKILSRKN